MSRFKKLTTIAAVAALALGLAACGGGGDDDTAMEMPPPPPPPTPYEMAIDNIAAAGTAAAAQAAYEAVKDSVTAAEGDLLQAAVDARTMALATAARAAMQRMDLMAAAGAVDTSDLATAADIAAANTAIAALKAAIAAAADVADTSMYQTMVDTAETAVMTAQGVLDHAAQTAALSAAVGALQAIDLAGLSTQAAIDAAAAAIAALRTALDGATELSAAEKTAAMTELATASRTVMAAQGGVDTASQMTMLADAVAALAGIDLDALMTQEDIDAANAAIVALDLALEAATHLTAAQKLDATVDKTLAERKVGAAETALASNVGDQRMALTEAGTALAEIDLDDLSDQAKIDAADAAVDALQAALDGATHLSDADKAMYQTQLDAADDAVKMAQTGMDSDERMTAQRTAIMSAVTMARTAVAGVNDDSTDSEVASADSAIAALQAAIDGADDLPAGDADVASAQGTLDTLEGQLNVAKTSRMAALDEADEEMQKAMAATGKAMRAALARPDPATPTQTALNNLEVTPPVIEANGDLTIDATEGAGSLPDDATHTPVGLKAGDAVAALGSWNGTDYSHSSGTGDARVTNEARVYNNRGPGTRTAFAKAYPAVDATTGYLAALEAANVTGSAFLHSGTKTHPKADSRHEDVYVRGYYDGAPGEFRCTAATTACNTTNDGKGSLASFETPSDWSFKPDAGAMVHQPDAKYLYYGWWVRKDSDGMPTAASAFAGVVRDDNDTSLINGWTGTAVPTGSATYAGNAAGKFSISNPLDGTGNGGHFTADAELAATFTGTNPGLTGTIDNFRLNDGSDDPGWSVALNRAAWGQDGAIVAESADSANTAADGTTWSINGNASSESGVWNANMYDEAPGPIAPNTPGDGSNIPTTVTGTWYSEFSTIGRMVGAFGANKQ